MYLSNFLLKGSTYTHSSGSGEFFFGGGGRHFLREGNVKGEEEVSWRGKEEEERQGQRDLNSMF